MPTITSSRRPVKPTRTKPRPAAPFAAGILDPAEPRLLEFTHLGGLSMAIWENEHPTDESYRYCIITYRSGEQVAVRQHDTLPGARRLARELAVAPRGNQGPSAEDRAWWAEHAPGRDSHYAVLPNWDRLAGEALAVDRHTRGLLIPIDVAEGVAGTSLVGHDG